MNQRKIVTKVGLDLTAMSPNGVHLQVESLNDDRLESQVEGGRAIWQQPYFAVLEARETLSRLQEFCLIYIYIYIIS